MTTPSINTPNGIICDAMRDAGLLQDMDEPSSEQYAQYLRRLRDVINTCQTSGLKLWVNEDIPVPLVAGTAAYTFKPSGTVDMTKPLRVLEGYYLFTTTNVRRPLTSMSLRDYWTLGQAGTLTANRGTVSQYLVEKQATQLKVTFWLCPDSTEADNGSIHLLMQTQITNPTNLTETMNFPEEWRMYLHWGLADEISTGQPPAIVARCAQKAEYYRAILENWDVEDASTSFAPDPRMAYGNNSFK